MPVNILAIFIDRAKEEGQIERLIPHSVEDGLYIHHHVDDIIFILGHDLEHAKNLNLFVHLKATI